MCVYKCLFFPYIFIYVPEDSFLKKPKYLAHVRGQKVLSENTFVMEDPFFLLSIHPSQTDDTTYDYAGHVTRNIEGSGIFSLAAILTAQCYVMFVSKLSIKFMVSTVINNPLNLAFIEYVFFELHQNIYHPICLHLIHDKTNIH
jgi:hypothetical protein